MADSETTTRQKREAFAEIVEWVEYLKIHGLKNITLEELRRAQRALDTTDVLKADV